ncbi:MAG: DUF2283 domain-containing protein [Nitrososphaerota archaeon]
MASEGVRFSRHAAEKLELLKKKYGFNISLNQVLETINRPVRVDRRGDQYLAIKPVDEKHALRVVYEVRENVKVVITIILLGETGMVYRSRYDSDGDVLLIVFRDEGKLDHADEAGDMVIHYGEAGEILMIEILNASKVVPKFLEALSGKEVLIP